MNKYSNYSLKLINKISEAKEISYYELKKIFSKYENEKDDKMNKKFDLDIELEKLEEKGLVAQEDGMIIFEDV
ncbi:MULTISPECIES: DEAD/DEAH box helicase [Clostridium]|uniref:DEAD/DEAH box helicase n=1 Tax=Clostridium aquiflavi TaxID=3073603 RepID=A0ABU1EL90_9CLOT|nr:MULTISPECIES: DEAD/DEAH box helicase [unclassified Clostridium]MDR5588842.1 DEAD/DEAH box helicase [Clostridium sp. 5N-1]NFG62958.1 DEAD/DEAH box helicase [Clostridium botulinum]NFQ08648.1 DEAD/DEAH box helicase [Clostridium botulinum]